MINSAVFDNAPLLTSNWSSGDALLPTTPWAHELMHTLGVQGHGNSYDCGTETISLVTAANPIKAYGDPFSLMGEHAFAIHPDVMIKMDLGWLSPDQVVDVTASGSYLIYPLENSAGNVKGLTLKVSPPITNNNHSIQFDRMVVEYRQPSGFDRYLLRLDGSVFLSTYKPEGSVAREGVLVRLLYPDSAGTDTTLLLDMNPATSYNPSRGIMQLGNVGKFADAILPVGQTFNYQGLSITPRGANAAGAMQVDVVLP